jgi:hypothetical protein
MTDFMWQISPLSLLDFAGFVWKIPSASLVFGF